MRVTKRATGAGIGLLGLTASLLLLLRPSPAALAVLLTATAFICAGYLATLCWVPDHGRAPFLARLALVTPLAVAVTAAPLLALAATRRGIDQATLAIALMVAQALLLGLYAWRSRPPGGRAAGVGALPSQDDAPLQAREEAPRLSSLALAVGAIMVIAGGLSGALVAALGTSGGRGGFTELYVLAPRSELAEFPTRATVGRPIAVRVVVSSREDGDRTYLLKASLGDSPPQVLGPIALAAGESWGGEVRLTPSREGRQLARIDLYLAGRDGSVDTGSLSPQTALSSAEPYRSVHLWFDVSRP